MPELSARSRAPGVKPAKVGRRFCVTQDRRRRGPAWLVLKTAFANQGRATVEVYKAPPTFVDLVKRSAINERFQIRHSDAGTLMLDNPAPGAETWTTGPRSSGRPSVHTVARASDELRIWWHQHVTGIDWES